MKYKRRLKINSMKFFVLVTFFFIFTAISNLFAQGQFREKLQEKILNRRDGKDSLVEGKENGDKVALNSITVDGRDRTYILHLPPADKMINSVPLVFVLHGGGANAQNAMNMANMNNLADSEGFIVVYPNGSGRLKDKILSWNDGILELYAEKEKIDDVKFFRELIHKLEGNYKINLSRIYFTGISNGGIMSYKLACELSDKVAAIAPVAGSLPLKSKKPSEPVSLIVFNGTGDEHVPYNGGYGGKARAKVLHQSVADAVKFWVANNGCSPTPKKEESGSIIKEIYTGGKNDTEVVIYTIKGGGHSWPGGQEGLKYGNADPPTQEIDATKLMWEFFKQHSKH